MTDPRSPDGLTIAAHALRGASALADDFDTADWLEGLAQQFEKEAEDAKADQPAPAYLEPVRARELAAALRDVENELATLADTLTLRSAALNRVSTENDALRARLAAVEKIRSDLRSLPGSWVGPWVHSYNVLDALDAALDQETPA